MKKHLTTVVIILVAGLSAHAQTRQPVLRVEPFNGNGVSQSETSMMERLIASYVAELQMFRVTDARGQELALAETEAALEMGATVTMAMPLTADFVLGGTLGMLGDVYILTLETTRTGTGEKLSASDTAMSLSDIVLRARSLTRSLFGRADTAATAPRAATAVVPAASGPAVPPGSVSSPQLPAQGTGIAGSQTLPPDNPAPVKPARAVTIAELAGTWRGDKGLETVRLYANGTGVAVLSGGGTMKVRISVDGPTITVLQDQANTVAMYRAPSITLEIARIIAAKARPMKWIFTLDADNATLQGIKESVAVNGSGAATTVDNTYVREAAWTRVSR